MKLEGGTQFLVLHREGILQQHFISLCRRFDDVISGWKAGNRVSPIFSINNSSLPNLDDGEKRRIWFIGPIHPGRVVYSGTIFLSLGIYNIVLLTENQKEDEVVAAFVYSAGVNFERWNLVGHEIESTACNISTDTSRSIPAHIFSPVKVEFEELRGSIYEYRAQIAASVTETAKLSLPGLSDLLIFDFYLKCELAKNHEEHSCSDIHRLLTIANSALGRQSEQILAGTTPIIESESHVWSHSLLGLGIASLALRRIRSFVEDISKKAMIVQRLEILKDVEPSKKPLYGMNSNDTLFLKDHLFDYPQQKDLTPDEETNNPVIPLLTSFSGRDGFRSTEISLSAPLAVIASCNSSAWTLLTLTHEMVHVIINRILRLLLPHPEDGEQLLNAIHLLNESFEKRNLFERLQEFICFAFWALAREGNVEDENIRDSDLSKIIRDNWSEASEIITHIFDFLYFYRGDEKHYVRSIWVSWGVIPEIRNRIPSYLIRTICALHSKNIKRQSDRYGISVDQCKQFICEAFAEYPKSPYLKDAIDELETNRDRYIALLKSRELLVKFVRYFLFSPEIGSMIEREPYVSGGSRGGYNLEVLDFSDSLVKNPLRFIEEFSREKTANKLRSVWMLQQLAFEDQK